MGLFSVKPARLYKGEIDTLYLCLLHQILPGIVALMVSPLQHLDERVVTSSLLHQQLRLSTVMVSSDKML